MRRRSRHWLLVLSTFLTCYGQAQSYPELALTLSTSTTMEQSDAPVEVTISASSPLHSDVEIQFTFAGDAKHGVDYDFPRTIRLPPNTTSYTEPLVPIYDWIRENNETVTLRISHLSGAATVASQRPQRLTIVDHFESWYDPDQDGIAEPTLIQNVALQGFLSTDSENVTVTYRLWNSGTEVSPEGSLMVIAASFVDSVLRPISTEEIPIGTLLSKGHHLTDYTLPLASLEPNTSYLILAAFAPNTGRDDIQADSAIDLSFATDQDAKLIISCRSPERDLSGAGVDPLLESQWHLRNTGQDLWSTETGTDGADLRMSQVLQDQTPTGSNVEIALLDSGLDICHPDLSANVNEGKSFNFAAVADTMFAIDGSDLSDPYSPQILGDHGTLMAGLIASQADNGIGGRGVAPNAKLRAFTILSSDQSELSWRGALGGAHEELDATDVDVFNMSLGLSERALGEDANIPAALETGTTSLREGKGAIYVKSSGNSFSACYSHLHPIHAKTGCLPGNIDFISNSPHVINVAAVNANDARASYSSASANVWIAAPGGESDGETNPALVSTDQASKDRGLDFLHTVYSSVTPLNPLPQIDMEGDYIHLASGTSSSAAVVSGIVALLLETNPDLTWRDVKHVLANTARMVQPWTSPVRVAVNDVPVELQTSWIINEAGYAFHNWFGFGAVNVDEAISFTKNITEDNLGEQKQSAWTGTVVDLPIPDFHGGGVTFAIEIDQDSLVSDESDSLDSEETGESTANIEHVMLEIDFEHERLSDLAVILTSPAGTRSVVQTIFDNSLVRPSLDTETLAFPSNAFYGESPLGTWHIQVVDLAPSHVGEIIDAAIQVSYGRHPSNLASD